MDQADELRAHMVARLTAQQSLSEEIQRAFRAVPRHVFLPGVPLEKVYSGDVIPTRFDAKGDPISSSSEVAVMTAMIHVLRLEQGQRVLEIGAGTGYNAAVLAELVGKQGRVTTIDIDDEIVAVARERLERSGHRRVHVVSGDGWEGWAQDAPYDRIELTASAADLSPRWSEQLAEDGLLVVPFQFRPNAMAILALRRDGHRFVSTAVLPGGFMPLRGLGAPADARRSVGQWRVIASRPFDEDRLAALLATRPTVELGEPLPWMAFSMFAALDADVVTITKGHVPVVSLALYDEATNGLAAVEWAAGNLAGQRTFLVGFGEPETLERLRARLAGLRSQTWRDVHVIALPAGATCPEGDAVFERPNYTFVLSASR